MQWEDPEKKISIPSQPRSLPILRGGGLKSPFFILLIIIFFTETYEARLEIPGEGAFKPKIPSFGRYGSDIFRSHTFYVREKLLHQNFSAVLIVIVTVFTSICPIIATHASILREAGNMVSYNYTSIRGSLTGPPLVDGDVSWCPADNQLRFEPVLKVDFG